MKTLAPMAIVEETTAFDAGRTVHYGRFAVADAIRLAAILAVVMNHLMVITQPQFLGHGHQFGYLGKWGVTTFFVLSGYLLSGPYLRSILHDATWPSTRLFLMRRVLRIVPLYLAALLFSVVVVCTIGNKPSVRDIVMHALMLHDFSAETAQSINGPLWTMPIDFEFYLALPVLAFAAMSIVRVTVTSNRHAVLVALLIAGISLSILYRFSVIAFMHSRVEGTGSYVFLDNGIGMASAFLTGVVLALVFQNRKGRISTWGVAAYLFGALVLMIIYVRVDTVSTTTLVWTLRPFVGALSAAILLYVLPQIESVVALAQTRTVAAGASLAYAIYLLHLPVLDAASKYLRLGQGNVSFVMLAIAAAAVVTPLAYIFHRFVERPFLIIKDRQR